MVLIAALDSVTIVMALSDAGLNFLLGFSALQPPRRPFKSQPPASRICDLNTLLPWLHGTIYPVVLGSWHHGTSWYHICLAPWYYGIMLPYSPGSTVSRYHGTMLPSLHGAMAPCYPGSVMFWLHGVSQVPGHIPWRWNADF